MKVIGWRAWYDDDQVYDSRKTDWPALPDDGLIIVMVYFDENTSVGKPYRQALQGYDWYFRAIGHDDWIFGGNNDDPNETRSRYKEASIKRGRWTDSEFYRKTVEKAFAIEDFN